MKAKILAGGYALLFIFLVPAFGADDFAGQTIKGFRYPDYDPQGQLKMEIGGDQARVLPNGLIQINNLKMAFYEEGKKVMQVATPLCLYDRSRKKAVSTAEVWVTRAEIVITGRGFEWNEKESRMRINDRTRVMIEKNGPRPQLERARAENDTNCAVITSVRLIYDQKKSTAVFESQVVVTDAALKIESDRLTVLFANDKKVETINAEGNVVITRNALAANAQKAIYTVKNGKITLYGQPGIIRARDRLTAETIVFWRDSNRILCEPAAHLIMYSEQDTRGQFRQN